MAKTIGVTVQFSGAAPQLIQVLRGIGVQGQTAVSAITNLNTGVQRLNRTSGAVASGIGGFFLLHKILDQTSNVMKEGMTSAQDLEMTLFRLQKATGASTTEMKKLRDTAELVGAALPKATTQDTLEFMFDMSKLVGATTDKILEQANAWGTAATAVSMFVRSKPELSEVSALMTQLMFTTGGFKSPIPMSDRIRKFQAGMMVTDEPQAFTAGIRGSYSALAGYGMSLDDIVQLNILRTMHKIGGGRSTGRDLAKLVDDSLTAIAKAQEKRPKEREKIFERLRQVGLMRGNVSAGITPEGNFDLYRFFQSVSTQFDYARKTGGQAAVTKLQETLALIPGIGEMARRVIRLGVLPETLSEIQGIGTKYRGFVGKGGEIVRGAAATKAGEAERFWSTAQSILANAFDGPNSLAGRAYKKLGDWAEKVMAIQQKAPGLSSGMGFAVTGLAWGLKSTILGLMVGGLVTWLGRAGFATLFGETIGGLVLKGITALSTFLMGGGMIAAVAAVIGAVVIAGVAAYKYSPAFQQSVDMLGTYLNDNFVKPFKDAGMWIVDASKTMLKALKDLAEGIVNLLNPLNWLKMGLNMKVALQHTRHPFGWGSGARFGHALDKVIRKQPNYDIPTSAFDFFWWKNQKDLATGAPISMTERATNFLEHMFFKGQMAKHVMSPFSGFEPLTLQDYLGFKVSTEKVPNPPTPEMLAPQQVTGAPPPEAGTLPAAPAPYKGPDGPTKALNRRNLQEVLTHAISSAMQDYQGGRVGNRGMAVNVR